MKLLGRFLVALENAGYEVEGDELLRSKMEAKANAASGTGIVHSLHTLGLAIDLQVFRDGIYLSTVEAIRPVGEIWKGLHPLCCWGGDFKSMPDADHYSLTWQGVK